MVNNLSLSSSSWSKDKMVESLLDRGVLSFPQGREIPVVVAIDAHRFSLKDDFPKEKFERFQLIEELKNIFFKFADEIEYKHVEFTSQEELGLALYEAMLGATLSDSGLYRQAKEHQGEITIAWLGKNPQTGEFVKIFNIVHTFFPHIFEKKSLKPVRVYDSRPIFTQSAIFPAPSWNKNGQEVRLDKPNLSVEFIANEEAFLANSVQVHSEKWADEDLQEYDLPQKGLIQAGDHLHMLLDVNKTSDELSQIFLQHLVTAAMEVDESAPMVVNLQADIISRLGTSLKDNIERLFCIMAPEKQIAIRFQVSRDEMGNLGL